MVKNRKHHCVAVNHLNLAAVSVNKQRMQIVIEKQSCMFHLEQWFHPDLASPIGSKFRGKGELERVNNVQKPMYLTVKGPWDCHYLTERRPINLWELRPMYLLIQNAKTMS
jgi:hypothetical protein